MRLKEWWAFSCLGIFLLTGCGPNQEEGMAATGIAPGTVREGQATYQKLFNKLSADAGIPLLAPGELVSSEFQTLSKGVLLHERIDPFALLPGEIKLEQGQKIHQIMGQIGGFLPLGELVPSPNKEMPLFEKPPFRRLAGIIAGNGIMALIEKDNGVIEEVYPGSEISNSDWMVAFLDQDKAILRRKSQKLPKEIVIYLESRKESSRGRISAPIHKLFSPLNQVPTLHDSSAVIPGPIAPSKKPKNLDKLSRIFGPEILPPKEVPLEPAMPKEEDEKEEAIPMPDLEDLHLPKELEEDDVSFNGKKVHKLPPGEM